MERSERYVLQRLSDGLWFCDAYENAAGEIIEWTDKKAKARYWLDLSSAQSASETWLEIHGEQLEIKHAEQ